MFEVVIVVGHDVDIVDLRAKCVFFEEGFDFVLEDTAENLQDGQMLVSDLEIPASAIAHKDTATLLV